MALNTTVEIPARTWTQLTNADVTDITIVNEGPNALMIKVTARATPPTDFTAGITYLPNSGERFVALADVWPGIAATRVYAYCGNPTQVVVSHA